MPANADKAKRDGGYALVAAVTAVAAFGYIALQILAADQGAIATVSSRVEQAKLAAAADAGISLAVHGLAAKDRFARWTLDGRPRRMTFGDTELTITLEDERGKAPVASLSDGQARALFAGAGASGEQLDALVAEFRFWQTDPAAGADALVAHLPPLDGRPIRQGPVRTIGELGQLPDMTPDIYAKIAPALTVFFEDTGPFETKHALPPARAAMDGDLLAEGGNPDAEPQTDQQQPELDIAPDDDLIGRTITVRVVARSRGGAQTHKMQIVELTGDKAQPYWVRYTE